MYELYRYPILVKKDMIGGVFGRNRIPSHLLDELERVNNYTGQIQAARFFTRDQNTDLTIQDIERDKEQEIEFIKVRLENDDIYQTVAQSFLDFLIIAEPNPNQPNMLDILWQMAYMVYRIMPEVVHNWNFTPNELEERRVKLFPILWPGRGKHKDYFNRHFDWKLDGNIYHWIAPTTDEVSWAFEGTSFMSTFGVNPNKEKILKLPGGHDGIPALEWEEVTPRGRFFLRRPARRASNMEMPPTYITEENLLFFKALLYDRNIFLNGVRRNGLALQYAPPKLRNDLDLVTEAVTQNGLSLQYAAEKLRNNREIVLLAVRNDGQSLQYASEDLQADREIVLVAERAAEARD